MKKHRRPALALLAALTMSSASAQIRIEVAQSPAPHAPGERAELVVTVVAEDGFDASVNLTVSAPSLGANGLQPAALAVNGPYPATARASFVPIAVQAGRHAVVVEGRNAGIRAVDTAYIDVARVPGLRGWTSFATVPFLRSSIHVLEVDRDSKAWVGTTSGVYHGDITSFRTIPYPLGTGESFEGVRALAVDSTAGIWMLRESSNDLERFDGATWTKLRSGSTLPWIGPGIIDVAVAPDRTVYALGPEGVLRFDGTRWEKMDGSPSGSKIAISREGAIVVVGLRRVARFDGRYWTERAIPAIDHAIHQYNDIVIDDEDRTHIGTENGVARITPDGEVELLAPPGVVAPGRLFTGLALDRRGELWTGVYSTPEYSAGGLARRTGGGWSVMTRYDSGLPDDAVTRVRSAPDGSIWIGTFRGGLARFDPAIAASIGGAPVLPDVLDLR